MTRARGPIWLAGFACQIGSFPWFGLFRIREAAVQFGSAAYQAAMAAHARSKYRQRGIWPGHWRRNRPARRGRADSDFPKFPLD
jgi:hypothetical protein